jgi:hypothetical protein
MGILGEFEPDDLEQVPGTIGADGEDLGRVCFRFEIDDGDCVLESVENGSIIGAVFVRRAVYLHIRGHIVIRNI